MTIIVNQAASNGRTFLDLCKRLRLESGTAGNGPNALDGQSAEYQRLIGWVNTAWVDLQGMHNDWKWMRSSLSFPTVHGQGAYSPAECGALDFGRWDQDTFRCFDAAVGPKSETFMDWQDYDAWRNTYEYGANRFVFTRPGTITILPDQSIGLGPASAAGYVITGDYYRAATEMVAGTDIPDIPDQYRMAIVWKALEMYGFYEESAFVITRAQRFLKPIISRMEIEQLPGMKFGGCLA